MMDSYCDVLVLRHPEPFSAKVCSTPYLAIDPVL